MLRAARKVELREALEPALGERAPAVPGAALHMSTHTCDDGRADSLSQPADSLYDNTAPDNKEWVSFLEAVIAQYKDDPNMMIDVSTVTGRLAGDVDKYLREVEIIAARYFGDRVAPWDEHHDESAYGPYGWDEVYTAAEL
ncbi:hypothetical protein DFH09DRAFT_1316493 [Mycena vulgaris]|nr:hypothetical protein DFH09DRAFT_1316493 [Mycena vulgaris]